jgi:hypothetical protein
MLCGACSTAADAGASAGVGADACLQYGGVFDIEPLTRGAVRSSG